MLTQFSDWFASLNGTMQVLWCCAIVASVIFVIQNALMLMGLGDMDSDVDADVSTDFDVHTDMGEGDVDISSGHSGHEGTLGSAGIFSLFTLRNFINFFLGFGWGGISLARSIHNPALLILASFVCGILFVAIFVVLLKAILRLESNGSFRISECVGCTASVYLRIPGQHTAAGKVQVSTGGAIHELRAFTDGEAIASGSRVRVVSVIDGETLLVEPM